jgi:hypothetical protein
VRSEIEAAERWGEGEVSAVVAVDEDEGRIAGYAVWGWGGKVSFWFLTFLSFDNVDLELDLDI